MQVVRNSRRRPNPPTPLPAKISDAKPPAPLEEPPPMPPRKGTNLSRLKEALLQHRHAAQPITEEEAAGAAVGSPGKYKIAYDAAQYALSQQDSVLTNLKNRAMGLITIAALVGSFSSFFGFGKEHPLPIWFAICVVTFILLILACVTYVLSPNRDWHFGPDPKGILNAQDYEHKILWGAAKGMVRAVDDNAVEIKKRVWVFFAGVVLLGLEAAFVVAASISAR
ncbi:hypothetical protein OG357_38660 (plasmid) [Streptomyces sp. NBC_01255]|uniref:hypothetical protein n=1 Tax=Streptomyces sp. NBC_01255 TaxID=2903798 RepID=UPI002E324808|nr:hypothetical protein [Streptomyces sp. NBC_01255]